MTYSQFLEPTDPEHTAGMLRVDVRERTGKEWKLYGYCEPATKEAVKEKLLKLKSVNETKFTKVKAQDAL